MGTHVHREKNGVVYVTKYNVYGDWWTRWVILPKAKCVNGGLKDWVYSFTLPDPYNGPGSKYETAPVIRRLFRKGVTWGFAISQIGGYDN